MIKSRPLVNAGLYCATLLATVLWFSTQALPAPSGQAEGKIRVFVSILPQANFVERVGAERVHVSVMVGPGQSPATYEPTPLQTSELSRAELFFSIGVPFESVWMGRLAAQNPKMRVIETGRGIELLPMKSHHHGMGQDQGRHMETSPRHHGGEGLKDPHIWLSLRLAKIQARNICDGLISHDPGHRAYYEANLKAFHKDLDELDAKIAGMLTGLERRNFMIFHPALGYFARDYRLEQIPVETEGKEPSAKTLAGLIEQGRAKGVRVVFVQRQFSARSAGALARAIGARVVSLDPLAKDYLKNMEEMAEMLAEAMR